MIRWRWLRRPMSGGVVGCRTPATVSELRCFCIYADSSTPTRRSGLLVQPDRNYRHKRIRQFLLTGGRGPLIDPAIGGLVAVLTGLASGGIGQFSRIVELE